MRRSAAPSQAGRPKFVSPILLSKSTTTTVINKQAPTCTNRNVPEASQKSNILKRIFPESCNNGQCDEETSSDDKDDSKQAAGYSEENFISQVAKKPRFQAPSFNTPTITSSPVTKLKTNNENIGEEDKGIASGYFSVVWCKRSNKKHKKWEGDAVLVTRGRSVTLYDIEGKEIGKGSGYKSAELASLKEDETLPIGGKEIQVMSLLTEDLFKSGKCFTGNTVTSSASLPKVPVKSVSKPFSKPLKAGCIDSTVSKSEPDKLNNYCLVLNWHQEFKKWLGFERLQVYAVSSDKKVEDFMKTSLYPVLIISYEMFVRMFETLQQLTFDLIVCDEGHRLKNTNIKTTSLIMSLPTQRRVVLTGTPIQNDLQEFFSIVEFCNPGVLGTSAGFRRVYEDPIVASRQPGATKEEISLGEERGAELSRMTQMFILRRTQEINNKYLPPKRDIVLFCRPSALQLTLYQQLLRCQLIRSCLSGSMSGSPHLICIGALKQLCNHPSLVYKKSLEHEDNKNCEDYDENRSVYGGLHGLFPEGFCIDKDLEEHSGKLAVLSSLLQHLNSVQSAKPEKIVVVSNHTKTLDLIQCLCDQIQYKYLRLDGQTPTSKRQELVQRFNSKHSPEFIFLLSSKAGGVGLNLVGASRLVLYDIDWNPANDLQAMARVWRDGQKNVVHIYRLLTTGSIEEKIYQRQISKQGLSGAVMDVREKNTAVQFSLKDLRDLFSVNMSTDCDTHDLLNCDCGARNTVQPVQQNIHTATNRPCQLGVKAMPKRQNLGMDELMEWKHLPSSVINKHPTWYLQDTIQNVSFVFYNEINGNTKQDSNISGVT